MVNTDCGINVLAGSLQNDHGLALVVIRARITRAGPSKDVDANTYPGKACVSYRRWEPCFNAYQDFGGTAVCEARIWRAALKIVGRDASIGTLKAFGHASEIIWIAPLPEDVGVAQSEAMWCDIEQLAEWVRLINSRIEKTTETGLYLANHAATYDANR